jgi:hypothetical protein
VLVGCCWVDGCAGGISPDGSGRVAEPVAGLWSSAPVARDVNVAAKVAGLPRSRVRVLDSTPCWRRLTSMDCTNSSATAGLMLNAGSRRDRIALSAVTGVLGKACVLFSWTLIRSIW